MHDRGLVRSISSTRLAESFWGINCDTVRRFVHDDGTVTTLRGTGVRVAVIDSGVLSPADDLASAHFVDARDFVENDYDPQDLNGHGTHVTGTIAQRTGNQIGCAGIAPDADIIPIRVLDADGKGGDAALANGIRWAMKHNADVINLSLGYVDRNEAPTAVALAILDANAQVLS
jgi:subtilisin family serine protease